MKIPEDPLELIGHDISYDDFMDWLDLADGEEDLGLESLQGVYDALLRFRHYDHAEVVKIKMNGIVNTYVNNIIIGLDGE